jgi:hypothetical protein
MFCDFGPVKCLADIFPRLNIIEILGEFPEFGPIYRILGSLFAIEMMRLQRNPVFCMCFSANETGEITNNTQIPMRFSVYGGFGPLHMVRIIHGIMVAQIQ